MRSCLLLVTLACYILAAWSCKPDQWQNGCKIYGNTCKCGYGCRSEYIYITKKDCVHALRDMQAAATAPPQLPERVSNICSNIPCSRGGICIQTTNDPAGFTCKCEGTGFYGQRCEKACPTNPIPGMVFPHECVVI